MDTENLMEVPAAEPAPRAQGALRYACPECWRRAEILIPPEEPPYCDACDRRMILIRRSVPPASGHLSRSDQPSLPGLE